MKTILWLVVVFAVSAAKAQTLPPVKDIGKFDFWFYSPAFTRTFLDDLNAPEKGLTAVTPGGYEATYVALAHAKGLAYMGGLGGGSLSDIPGSQRALDHYAAVGVDAIYVDEPGAAPASVDPTRNPMSAASIAYNVRGFNRLIDYWRSKRPGGHFGLTMGDGGSVEEHIALLKAGLKEDFASYEQYGASHVDVFAGFKSEFPNVKTMLLLYNSIALCSGPHGLGNQATDAGGEVDIFAFWNLDNYGNWIGPNLDADWLKDASHFAATGDRSFCFLPASEVNGNDWTWAEKKADFTLNGVDAVLWTDTQPGDPAYQIASCEYRVVSGADVLEKGPSFGTITRDWTTRPCNGAFTVTVGPGKDCRDSGRLTCLVYTRATLVMSANACGCQYGRTSYNQISVKF
jgi:hypothetical protein